MKKINFRSPKYIFPLVIFLPLVFVSWQLADLFAGEEDGAALVEQNGLNMDIPQANTKELGSKLQEMQRRYGEKDENALSAIGAIDDEFMAVESSEESMQGYSDDELAAIAASLGESANAGQSQQEEYRRAMQAAQEQAMAFRDALKNNSSNNRQHDYSPDRRQQDINDYQIEMERLAAETKMKQQIMAKAFGLNEEKTIDTPSEPTKPTKQELPKPQLVLKSPEANADRFHSIQSEEESAENSLIKAMIDKTTKASDGTRLRFKLLDDVTIPGRDGVSSVSLKKGTFLYGTVTGFKQQRVMANITSILVGNQFINVDLAVFDNDGMEGFYVPESSFREFMKNAGSQAVQSNINISSGGYGEGVSAEMMALQALQNVYSSATNALSQNFRKNKATIKYNTIVYLINSNDAR